MKKFIIGATALGLSVALVGCGNGTNNAAITNLSNQLDSTANTISSIQTVNPTDLNLTKASLDAIATRDNSEAIYDNVIGAQQTLLGEEYYKMDILHKTATLKNNLSKDLKLSKAQITAVKELTNNLDKYTNSVAYTKNELNTTVKSISSLKKNVEKNSDRINAKLNRLACNSNTRSAYYQNILTTLAQLEKYIGSKDCEENNNSTPSQQEQENPISTDYETKTENKASTRNIDTYLPNINNNSSSQDSTNNQNCPTCQPKNDESIIYSQYGTYNANNFNRANRGFYGNGYRNGFYGAPYAGPFGSYGYGFGNQYYGFNPNIVNNPRFNPARNTDTYAPLERNIDTYGFPTNEGALNNTIAPVATQLNDASNPRQFEERAETFEKINEDGTIEKTSPISEESNVKNFEKSNANNEDKHDSHKDCLIQTSAQNSNLEEELNQPTIAH